MYLNFVHDFISMTLGSLYVVLMCRYETALTHLRSYDVFVILSIDRS